jgi:5-methylthioadenosine/S-adenosylhomocysteine deaminase
MMEGKEKFEIIIQGGILLTMVDGQEPIHDARVLISDNRIQGISEQSNSPLPETDVLIDAGDAIILPGLVNTHVHSPMTVFRGMADDLPLKSWLFDHIFPAEARYMDPDTVFWASLLACLEMIESGTTTFIDGYFFADDIIRATDKAGMRALVAQGVIDFPAPGAPEPEKNLDVALSFLKKWTNFSDLITPGIFCHTPSTCSKNTLQKAYKISNELSLTLQLHLSETKEEVEDIEKMTGLRPVFFLDSLGLLDSDLIAVHAIHLNEEEIELLAEKDVKIVHCPESSMKLGSGIAEVAEMLAKGLTVGIGTDGCASNNNLDLFGEMDATAKLAKVTHLDPTLLDAKKVLNMATAAGTRIIGLEKEIGTIEAGKKADIIIVDTNTPHMTPMYNPYSQLVYSATGGDVRDVIINGKIVYKDRQFTAIDRDEVMKKAKTIGQRIFEERGKYI